MHEGTIKREVRLREEFHFKMMKLLYKVLKTKSDFTDVTLISNAKVPVIKLVDAETTIPIDICFCKTDGVSTVAFLKWYLEVYPDMRYIVFIIK